MKKGEITSASAVETTIPTVHDVINDAIRENRFSEILLYCLAVTFVVVGVFVIVWSLFHQHAAGEFVGLIASALFWPAFNGTTRIRKENQMIRLMEIPLTRASTADEAARLVSEIASGCLHSPTNQQIKRKAEAGG